MMRTIAAILTPALAGCIGLACGLCLFSVAQEPSPVLVTAVMDQPSPVVADPLPFRILLETAWIREYADPGNDHYSQDEKAAKIAECCSRLHALALEVECTLAEQSCSIQVVLPTSEGGAE